MEIRSVAVIGAGTMGHALAQVFAQNGYPVWLVDVIDNGYATPEDIDEAAKNSFALRTPILGLVKRFDFTGLDLTQKILRNRQYEPPGLTDRSPTVDALVAQGKLGAKTGSGFYDYGSRTTEEIMKERDLKLLKLREFLERRDDLLTQFNEAVPFLKKHLNVRSEIRGLNREDINEIPLEVLREAIVNALMHRDYSITGTQVSVEVYDDRVEIVNLGAACRRVCP